MHRHFIIACFVFSFLFSLLLLWGPIEDDFFLYYYVGRAIVLGQDMFADIAQNKGPVFYLFMAGLYRLFGTNYGSALVVGSTVLDAGFCITLASLIQRWFGPILLKKKVRQWFMALTMIVYVKSFSIGSMLGGLYPEQLAMVCTVISLLYLEKKHYTWSGIAMACAIFSRQSAAGFLLVAGILLWMQERRLRSISLFLIGLVSTFGGFILLWWRQGTLPYVIENTVTWIYWFRQTTAPLFWPTAVLTIFSTQVRVAWSLLFIVLFSLYYFMELRRMRLLSLYCGLLSASVLVVFGGGLLWGHHFFQWTPIFLFCACFMWKRKRKTMLLSVTGVIVFVSVCLSYIQYIHLGRIYGSDALRREPFISEIAAKKYLLLPHFGSKLYLDHHKESPDRYYSPLFWLNPHYTGAWTQRAISRHKQTASERLRDTAFVFVFPYGQKKEEGQWYLDQFAEVFRLKLQSTYIFGSTRIEIFFSGV